ncbi:hypothetical protein BD410DRAFT_715760 [Rickenella mellea]|uniref:UbiA prenyltransferase n=1 Tax=Rickenella mellea TaxID=50990 RepID=A0A4Y7QG44_9AGAM|nr:hypothetical protein BD410DRAFT_715760 [Rickenella mellea]
MKTPPTSVVLRNITTIYLFTHSDYKTIFFPVVLHPSYDLATAHLFACQLFHAATWIWCHLLECNVSNQTFSAEEDIINKPWRPLPSGRIDIRSARALRWFLMIFCLFLSIPFGRGVFCASAALALVQIVHDDFGLSGHPISKNLCNVGGYLTFEVGSTLVISSGSSLDRTVLVALANSALVIFTTIHAQDFADTEGDRMSGRQTLPIVAPEGSRIYILTALFTWSFVLTRIWDLGPASGTIFIFMGALVGIRYFRFRDKIQDQLSFLFYSIWLFSAHLLPMNARGQVLAW